MVIYADILFFMNFIMDYIIISLCCMILNERVRIKRKILASLIGASYGVFVFSGSVIYSPFGIMVSGIVITALLFLPCKKGVILKNSIVFIISAFVVSGGVNLFLPFITGDELFCFMIILPAILCLALTAKAIEIIRNKEEKYEVTVKYKGYFLKTKGIRDTGNMLSKDGKSVIVADENFLKDMFSKDCTAYNLPEWIDMSDFHRISYKSIDKEGVMPGFSPELLKINGRKINNVIIAISPMQKCEHGLIIGKTQ